MAADTTMEVDLTEGAAVAFWRASLATASGNKTALGLRRVVTVVLMISNRGMAARPLATALSQVVLRARQVAMADRKAEAMAASGAASAASHPAGIVVVSAAMASRVEATVEGMRDPQQIVISRAYSSRAYSRAEAIEAVTASVISLVVGMEVRRQATAELEVYSRAVSRVVSTAVRAARTGQGMGVSSRARAATTPRHLIAPSGGRAAVRRMKST